MNKKKLTLRDLTPEEYKQFAIATHEAGHAIVATLLGDEVGCVTLTPDDPVHAGICSLSAERFPGTRHAAIAFAGPYAESYWRHSGPPTSAALRRVLADSGREDDRVIVASGEPRPPEVPRMVASCWGSIKGLAGHLFVHGSATQEDVDAALFLPSREHEPEAREFALASIRSGARPGSFKVVPAALT